MNPGVTLRECPRQPTGLVGRTIVNEDALPVREALALDRAQARLERPGRIAGGQQDGNSRLKAQGSNLPARRRAWTNSNNTGRTDTAMMPSTTSEKFCLTMGTLPKA